MTLAGLTAGTALATIAGFAPRTDTDRCAEATRPGAALGWTSREGVLALSRARNNDLSKPSGWDRQAF